MALTSASTYSDAMNQFLNNLSWRTNASAAELAAEAIDFMIVRRPASATAGGTSLSYNDLLEYQKDIAAVITQNASNRSPFTRGMMARP